MDDTMRKATVGVVGVVCLAAVATSLLLFGPFAQPAAQGPGETTAWTGSAATTTATPAPTVTPPTDTAAPAPVNTPRPRRTGEPTTESESPTGIPTTSDTSLAAVVNDSELGAGVVAEINAHRSERGVGELSTDTLPAASLAAMARGHAAAMADRGTATHVVGGESSADRYRNESLFDTCKFKSDGGGHVVTAEYNRLEVVGALNGSGYASDSTRTGQTVERLAADLVDRWYDDRFKRQKLQYENARWIGVGVEVDAHEEVYVTVTLC